MAQPRPAGREGPAAAARLYFRPASPTGAGTRPSRTDLPPEHTLDSDDDEEFEDELDPSADDSALVTCPCCGEPVDIALDTGGGAEQEYVQDCEICCRPWNVHVVFDPDGHALVTVTSADDDGDG